MTDWTQKAFFERRQPWSLDGGTTSAGHLWHSISPRWGSALHSMCSYYGMFPARMAHYFIERYSDPGAVVLDPFSGRGTTGLQARLTGRRAIGNDLNPLAYVLTRAKLAPPSWDEAMRAIEELENAFFLSPCRELEAPPEIRMLYHDQTLKQLEFLRREIFGKPLEQLDSTEAMIGGSLAGIMHGGWRKDGTSQYLSISMPNTFSMAPTYVARYIQEKGLAKLNQDVFEKLREKIARQYLDCLDGPDGTAFHADAGELLKKSLDPASVDLVVTSPPYMRVVNYGASNWIRLWFLGVDEVSRDSGEGRRRLDATLDHGHDYRSYVEFIRGLTEGIERVLRPDGVAVLVIGDVAEPGREPIPLAAKVWEEIGPGTNLRLIEMIEDDLPLQQKVTRIWGDLKGQATNRDCALVLTHANGHPRLDRVVDWEEYWKDGGPDGAHEYLKRSRSFN